MRAAAHRGGVEHHGLGLAHQQRKRFRKDTVLIVDGTLVPTRSHTVAEQSRNHPYSANHQVDTDTDTRLVVAVGQPVAGDRNDCEAGELSGASRLPTAKCVPARTASSLPNDAETSRPPGTPEINGDARHHPGRRARGRRTGFRSPAAPGDHGRQRVTSTKIGLV